MKRHISILTDFLDKHGAIKRIDSFSASAINRQVEKAEKFCILWYASMYHSNTLFKIDATSYSPSSHITSSLHVITIKFYNSTLLAQFITSLVLTALFKYHFIINIILPYPYPIITFIPSSTHHLPHSPPYSSYSSTPTLLTPPTNAHL